MGKRAASKAAKATPVSDAPEQVWLRCEHKGEALPFTPSHAARILALQERMRITGDAAWQPAAAPDSSDSK